MGVIRVAHISDLHLLSLRGVNPIAFVGKRLTGGVNLLLNRAKEFSLPVARALVDDLDGRALDHVIVSGDVSNLSFSAEFALARDLLSQLRLPASRVTVVPGNHDCYTLGARLRNDFGKILAPFLTRENWPDGDSDTFPVVRLQAGLAVIGLSTARPSAPLLAVGTLGKRQLRLTEAVLGSRDVQDRFRIVVLHHPPGPSRQHWHNRLTDAAAFRAMIARVGADLVLHGHLHRSCVGQLEGPSQAVPVVGVTSTTWLSPKDPSRRASYNIYVLQDGRLVGTERRVFGAETHRWDPAPSAV